jgi:hypothetical protein
MIDLILPVLASAAFAGWSRAIFVDLSNHGTSPARLGIYTLTVVNVLLWSDAAVRRYMAGGTGRSR